jgi:hypothetical protein
LILGVKVNHTIRHNQHNQTQWHKVNDFDFWFVSKKSTSRTLEPSPQGLISSLVYLLLLCWSHAISRNGSKYFFLSLCLFLSVCFHAVSGIWLDPTSYLDTILKTLYNRISIYNRNLRVLENTRTLINLHYFRKGFNPL